MTSTLLFCIAEEAKPLVYQVMNTEMYYPGGLLKGELGYFWLVETRVAPVPEHPGSERDSPDHQGQRFKHRLKKDEPFEAEWIGASEEDCEAWAKDMQYRVNYIEGDQIVIIDAQTARDGTVLVKEYVPAPETILDIEDIEAGETGFWPEETDTWHDFRMEPRYVNAFLADLGYSLATEAEPVYYGLKKELTNAQGVFDYEKALRIVLRKEPGYEHFNGT
ncbi:hypothetical protein GGR53DRAFT_110918 [Hypoxylon sp. FL1150]|nr:hypothetical protein GGR53DRAFT_110918 [Hypoxylon sp. FL1150]